MHLICCRMLGSNDGRGADLGSLFHNQFGCRGHGAPERLLGEHTYDLDPPQA